MARVEELPYDDEFWARRRFGDEDIVDHSYSVSTSIATERFVHVLGWDAARQPAFSAVR
jgi:hypothetical protein